MGALAFFGAVLVFAQLHVWWWDVSLKRRSGGEGQAFSDQCPRQKVLHRLGPISPATKDSPDTLAALSAAGSSVHRQAAGTSALTATPTHPTFPVG